MGRATGERTVSVVIAACLSDIYVPAVLLDLREVLRTIAGSSAIFSFITTATAKAHTSANVSLLRATQYKWSALRVRATASRQAANS